MILNIKKTYDPTYTEDQYNLSCAMLNIKSTHLFIASNPWDTINVDVDDEINEGCLRCLPMACSTIRVALPVEITQHTMQLLTELFPDKAGTIRKTFMQSGDLKGVLSGCLV